MNVSPEGLVHLWIVVDVTIVRFASWTDQSRYIPILNILDVTIVNVDMQWSPGSQNTIHGRPRHWTIGI